jgi:hypothetical protein
MYIQKPRGQHTRSTASWPKAQAGLLGLYYTNPVYCHGTNSCWAHTLHQLLLLLQLLLPALPSCILSTLQQCNTAYLYCPSKPGPPSCLC